MIQKNNVTNRFLPIPESVSKGLEPEPKITDFNFIKELGVGSFGRVILVSHKRTQAKYAIKAIDKRNQDNIEEKPYFIREIEIMYRVHHPNVVKLYGHFEDNNYCYFIMEYMPGGNIYTLIKKDTSTKFNIQLIASIMKDVISATYFLHNMNPIIIHRDIKPENVLLNENMQAKLTDFGWSTYMQDNIKRLTICGTPIYLAPEIINGQGHDEKVDIWCIGVLLFELLTGKVPFQGNNVDQVKYNIRSLKISWPREMDRDGADLISRILKYNPNERISLEQMLMHPFFTKFFPNAYSCLIKPDNTQYKVYIVSQDNPLTWNPVFTGKNYDLRLKPFYGNYNDNYQGNYQNNDNYNNNNYTNYSDNYNNNYNNANYNNNYTNYNDNYQNNYTDNYQNNNYQNSYNDNYYAQPISNSYIQPFNQNNYNNLLQKYDNLQREYYELRTAGFSTTALDSLRRELIEKENKINQLMRGTDTGYGRRNDLRITYNDLQNENYELKNKLSLYESQMNEQNPIMLDNDFNVIRDSIRTNNKAGFSQAMGQLRNNLDDYTKRNYNTIIMIKDREIERWKEEERLRREQEKQQFSNLINVYDQNLSKGEKENQELKMRLKELQSYFM